MSERDFGPESDGYIGVDTFGHPMYEDEDNTVNVDKLVEQAARHHRDDDQPTQCPECGIADEEFGLHEEGCPSGYPTRGSTIATADGVVIAQQRHIEIED